MSTPINKELMPFFLNKNNVNRFVISSDEVSDDNLPGPSGINRKTNNQSNHSKIEDDSPNKILVISFEEKTSDEGKSVIIERENEYLTYESTDDESENENVKKFTLQFSSSDSEW